MLTAEQLRAARALKRWDQTQIAEVSGVSVETIKRLERMEGRLAAVRGTTLHALETAYVTAGVIFVPENGEGPGVRLRKSHSAAPASGVLHEERQVSADRVRRKAVKAANHALASVDASADEKASRRAALTEEPAVVAKARGSRRRGA